MTDKPMTVELLKEIIDRRDVRLWSANDRAAMRALVESLSQRAEIGAMVEELIAGEDCVSVGRMILNPSELFAEVHGGDGYQKCHERAPTLHSALKAALAQREKKA